jgi:hypothetical protein
MREFNARPLNQEKVRARGKAYYRRNTEKWRADQLRAFGLTQEGYDRMLAAQGGGCAVCGGEQITKGKKWLSVDHCHETGVVRGLLCNNCNNALGHAKDDPARLRTMADYLERSRRPRLVVAEGR